MMLDLYCPLFVHGMGLTYTRWGRGRQRTLTLDTSLDMGRQQDDHALRQTMESMHVKQDVQLPSPNGRPTSMSLIVRVSDT